MSSAHSQLSISKQCELLGLSRSSFYYQKQPENDLTLTLLHLLDEQYTRTPFYGVPRMTAWLNNQGYPVNHKRVSRLMGLLGVRAVYPQRKVSFPNRTVGTYPYLLRHVPIVRVNQVWSIDITYIRLSQGFIYLVAVLDWFSRYVLSWEVSVTLDVGFCLLALEQALQRAQPEVFNSDQGSQFTCTEFTDRLQRAGVAISWDGRGRYLDNIFVERLWRTVKYEEVYLKDYSSVLCATHSLRQYFEFYNEERLHSSLGYETPATIYERNL